MEQVIESPVTSPQRTGGNAQQDVLVSVRELTKLYGTKVALSRVDLTVHAGEIVGLLGPNGAGKSTLLEILEGLKRASSGTALVLGKAPQALTVEERGHVGLVFQRYTLPRYLRVRELLHMYEVAYPYESSAGLAKTLGIAHLLNERIEHLSAGATAARLRLLRTFWHAAHCTDGRADFSVRRAFAACDLRQHSGLEGARAGGADSHSLHG